MLPVYICEDMPERLKILKKVIEKHIVKNKMDMEVVCAAAGPDEVLGYLRHHPEDSLYFLDLDLKTDKDGFHLAKEIRSYDPHALIVIVTTHAELSPMAFRYHIQAMDFIIKEEVRDFEARVLECMQEACRILNVKNDRELVLGTGMMTYKFDTSKICLITAGEHKIEIHETNATSSIPFSLAETQELLGSNFYRCHRSYIVNIEHIINIDARNKVVELDNGMSCPVAQREVICLKRLIKRRKL